MIELPKIEVSPPEESVRTEAIPKPQPETEKHEIWEMDHIFGPTIGHDGFDNAVLFSGGNDSLALTHLAMEKEGWADYVVHFDTNSSIPENIDYVRETCQKHNWPYIIISAPMSLFVFACRYGFPGPNEHSSAFNQFKGRQMSYLNKFNNGSMKFFSGVRKDESDRRLRNVSDEIQYSSFNFSGWWVSPLAERSDEWVEEYREKHDLSENPVSAKIHRSGDCGCFAYGNRDTELTFIQAVYPEYGNWLLNVEKRVQEYRGREYLLEDQYPEIADRVTKIRKQTVPNPMKLTVLKERYPEVYQNIIAVSPEDAILRGKQQNTSYIGHGGMSSKELRNVTSSSDQNQMTLCDNCDNKCSTVMPSVQEDIEKATKAFEQKTQQEKLPIAEQDLSSKVHRRMSQQQGSSTDESDYSQATLT